jgi:hypothetical protein
VKTTSSRSLIFLCLASLFAGLSIGYIKFFLLGHLSHLQENPSDKAWIIQALGALITVGPCIVFYFSGPLAAAFKKSWIMYLSALTITCLMFFGSLSQWKGSAWIYVFGAGLGLGVFNAARNSAVPIEAAKSAHSTEFINACVGNLYLMGLLFGVPLGTEVYAICPLLGGYINCLLFAFSSLFGLMSSIQGESSHLKSFSNARSLLRQDCQFLGKKFKPFLFAAPILWGIAGALSLAATAFAEEKGYATALMASLMSVYAAFGVGVGNFLATRLQAIRYKAAFASIITLSISIALTPAVAPISRLFFLEASTSYWLISILMLMCGFSFGCAANLIESQYLEKIYSYKQEGTGAALMSAKTALWTFVLGGLTGIGVNQGILDIDTQFIALALVTLYVATTVRKLKRKEHN